MKACSNVTHRKRRRRWRMRDLWAWRRSGSGCRCGAPRRSTGPGPGWARTSAAPPRTTTPAAPCGSRSTSLAGTTRGLIIRGWVLDEHNFIARKWCDLCTAHSCKQCFSFVSCTGAATSHPSPILEDCGFSASRRCSLHISALLQVPKYRKLKIYNKDVR